MMDIFLALVQIITESFPISSSTHCILIQHLFNLQPLTSAELDALHIPTVCMLAVYFRKEWGRLLLHMWRYRFCIKNMIIYGMIAESATVVMYCGIPFIAKKIMCAPLTIVCGLMVTANVLIATRFRRNVYTTKTITWRDALCIGVAQGIAVIPGISRLGITYAVGLSRGLSARKAFLFSCMLEVPLIAAGGMYGIFRLSRGVQYEITALGAIVLLSATFIAYGALWITQYMFEKNYTYIFGIYVGMVSGALLLSFLL